MPFLSNYIGDEIDDKKLILPQGIYDMLYCVFLGIIVFVYITYNHYANMTYDNIHGLIISWKNII